MSINFKKNNFNDDEKFDNKNIKRKITFLKISIAIVTLTLLFLIFSSLLKNISLGGFSKATARYSSIFSGGRKNILLIGVDGDLSKEHYQQNGRSDTLILFNIDPKSNSINAISIPRDSKVYIANSTDITKINHAFAMGGPQLTVSTIEDTFGITINHYIAVNYNVLRGIVDTVGGVDVYVEKDMHYRDRAAKLNINLQKGEQTLNSDTAEQFLRFRHDQMADIARVHRQQCFIEGLIKKFQNPSIIPKIPEIIKIVQNNVLTDMNLYELSELAAYMQGANLSQMQTTTLPGTPSQKGSVSYWILDPEQVQGVIDKFIYRIDDNYKTDNLTVGIAYNPRAAKNTIKVVERLQELGYEVKCTEKTDSQEGKIISHSDYVTLKTANYIKKKIHPLKDYSFSLSPELGYVCGNTDLSIIISK
jgi:LCP family protein required for cell wall assembly